jgi:VIT1/CCC1 family predicted Fe2+/Mn2+ transporter
MTSTTAQVQSKSISQTVRQSFMSALGSIVFGMEDGTVSIFGLVFGVAASATNSQTVLLAAQLARTASCRRSRICRDRRRSRPCSK